MNPYVETDEQKLLRSTVHEALADANPIAEARAHADDADGFDRACWRALAADMELAGLLVPAAHGGVDASMREVGIVLEEMGRFVYPGPFLAAAVLAPLVLRAADQDVAKHLEAVAAGEIYTVTGLHRGAEPRLWPDTVTAEQTADGWVLDGRATGVLHGEAASVLLVVARAEAGLGVWAVNAETTGHRARRLGTLDLTRRQSEHAFERATAELVLSPGTGTGALSEAAVLAAVALSAEQVGSSKQLLENTLEHLRSRYQFGRPIGSFQALKHRCADMAVALEGAIAVSAEAIDAAVSTMDGESDVELVRAAAVAGAHCSQAFLGIASSALQLHGGTGMAWEHDSHLYFRRATASEALFGTPQDHRRSLLAAVTAAR